jgi:ribosomal protein S27E
MQGVRREHPGAGRDHAGATDNREVPAMRRAQALPAVGGVPRPPVTHVYQEARAHSGRPGGEMTPRFKGVPNFDLSLPCPLCGYKIQPRELVHLASQEIKCPGCGEVFNEMGGRKPLSTS